MVSGDGDILSDASEYALSVVFEGGCLAVKDLTRDIDLAAIAVENALSGMRQFRAVIWCAVRSAEMRRLGGTEPVMKEFQEDGDLLSHTYAKDGDLAAVVLNGLIANTGVSLRVAWARAHDELCGVHGDEFLQRDLIVAIYCDRCALEDEVLVHVPGEGVIIVDKDDIRCGWDRRRRIGIAWRVVDQLEGRHCGWMSPEDVVVGICAG